MEKSNCLKCKHVAYVLINLNDERKSIFYCIKNEEIYMNTDPCSNYQEKNRKEE